MQSFIHKSSNHEDVFIVLHGSGGRETDLLDVVGEVDPNLSVLGIRGQVAGKGFRYFNRPVHGQFDFAEIEKNTHKLASFIADEQTKHGLTKSRLHLVGYSNGANMATSLLYTYPAMFESLCCCTRAIYLKTRKHVTYEVNPFSSRLGRGTRLRSLEKLLL